MNGKEFHVHSRRPFPSVLVLAFMLCLTAFGERPLFAQAPVPQVRFDPGIPPDVPPDVPPQVLIGEDFTSMDPATTDGGAAGTDRASAAEPASALGDILALASMAQGPQPGGSALPGFIQGMDPATTDGEAAGTDHGAPGRPAPAPGLVPASVGTYSANMCVDPAIIGAPPRPHWNELSPLLTPPGSGWPDYIDVTNNLQVVNSIRLLASIATRAAQSLSTLSSQVEGQESQGTCVCSALPTDVHTNVLRKDCNAQSFTACASTTPTGAYPLWLPTDFFKDKQTNFLFALKLLGFLDEFHDILKSLQGTQGNSAASSLLTALSALGTTLDHLNDVIQQYEKYVDLLTEGYHLGGYSTERPDLHLCVGYGGHNPFAEMASLFGGDVTIGSRYRSHNLSKEHRAQFRSGGFSATVFGHQLNILPGIEANMQIDGFKLWNVTKPFGIDFSQLFPDPNKPGIAIADIDKYDIFHLVKATDIKCPDNPPAGCNGIGLCCFDTGPNGSPDGYIEPGEFLIKNFYPAQYNNLGILYPWPRPGFASYDWEPRNTAVFGAGLNFAPKLKTIVKYIPTLGIPLYGPLPFSVVMFPKLTLDAGAEWRYKANDLRDRLKDSINKNLPAALQLTANSFDRPMHFLQAPDVSDDDTSSAFVKPGIGVKVLAGFPLGKYLTLGITATIDTSVKVAPQGHGGLHDLNVALTDALLHSNPSPDLPCDPIVDKKATKQCSNELLLDNTGHPLSSGEYSCDITDPIVYHCQEPEQDLTCTPDTARQDCPKTTTCVASRGCSAYGYCTRGSEVQQDTTFAACTGQKVCQEPSTKAGQPCAQDGDCAGPNICIGGTNEGNPCKTVTDCPRGACQATTASCEALEPGDFTAYQCLTETHSEITGWQGPGCHPLTVGFPSAIGCQSDTDCVAGQEKCVTGMCYSLSGNLPVRSDCDPGNPASACSQGRQCVEGACLLSCASNADCAVNQTCNTGVCVNTPYGTPPYSIPFAEQLVWQVSHTPKPQHAVSTYALSDIEFSAFLDAGLWIGLDLQLFKKPHHFDLFTWTDSWPLGTPINKTWYQAGLDARYQNDCDMVTGNTVTNWQPDNVWRYPVISPPVTPAPGNAGTEAALLGWCSGELSINVEDPDAPNEGSLATAVTDIGNWGEQIGLDVWSSSSMCVTMDGVSSTFTDWVGNVDTWSPNLMCTYTYKGTPYTFPCSNLRKEVLEIWGCLNVTGGTTPFNPFASPLAGHIGPTYLTTFGTPGVPVFDLDKILVDPTQDFTFTNLVPAIRTNTFTFGAAWYSEVTQCGDAGDLYDQQNPGNMQLLNVHVGPCCGNGILDTSGCGQPGGTPCEQCDDGNNLPGDGCSPLCLKESPPQPPRCGDGIVQVGLGEECDDGNNVPGDGCEPDCTRTRRTDSGNICVTKFDDLDGDGREGPAEPWLSGWRFDIKNAQGTTVGTVTSDEQNPACLSVPAFPPAPATYTITEELQPGWTTTTPNPQTVTVSAGQTVNVSFGNRRRTVSCVDPPALMVSWWPGDSNAKDIMGGNNGVLQGSAGFAPGIVGSAFRFSAPGGYVQVPDAAILNFGPAQSPPAFHGGDLSIDAWIKTSSTAQVLPIVDKRDLPSGPSGTQSTGYALFLFNGRLALQLGDGTFFNYISPGSDLRDGLFHHVAVTVDRSGSFATTAGNLYVDGALVLHFDPMNRPGSLINTDPLFIGRHAGDPTVTFSGLIDEVEIFHRALAQSEIEGIFNAGSFGKCRQGLRGGVVPVPRPHHPRLIPGRH
jgi:cysteine-rich repeat protein